MARSGGVALLGLVALLVAIGVLGNLAPSPAMTLGTVKIQLFPVTSSTVTLSGAQQTVNGRNDASSIVVDANYTLTLTSAIANPATTCPPIPSRIPWESGLLNFVASQTPRSGLLNLKYDKTTPDFSRIDNWTTTIGSFNYIVQVFRWASLNSATNSDGSTTVMYRGGSIEVFKKKEGAFVSREQCFGNFVNYDLNAL